jgi:uncharacterized protein (DUF2062 family)
MIHRCKYAKSFEALKARHSIAQRIALGSGSSWIQALKARNIIASYFAPSALFMLSPSHPARCAGLLNAAPSALLTDEM